MCIYDREALERCGRVGAFILNSIGCAQWLNWIVEAIVLTDDTYTGQPAIARSETSLSETSTPLVRPHGSYDSHTDLMTELNHPPQTDTRRPSSAHLQKEQTRHSPTEPFSFPALRPRISQRSSSSFPIFPDREGNTRRRACIQSRAECSLPAWTTMRNPRIRILQFLQDGNDICGMTRTLRGGARTCLDRTAERSILAGLMTSCIFRLDAVEMDSTKSG